VPAASRAGAPLGILVTFAVSLGLWLWTLRVLPNTKLPWRALLRGALLGAVLIGTLQNGLNTLSISNGWIYIVTGLVLLAAVTLDTVAVRLQARSGR